jgi:hypothetical protein
VIIYLSSIPAGDPVHNVEGMLRPQKVNIHAGRDGRQTAGIRLYGPAVAQDSFAAPSAPQPTATFRRSIWGTNTGFRRGMPAAKLIHTHDAL